ncbi:exonuclease 3'-5' domain-containing protein 2-like [Haliotis rufescens]|uniref:exonuclease 3'-5' domain-containing protein 2-like n=1 Tax=Haliotis rufescens TaxID=6454 RepID=UPI001EAFF45A|nr:exonuclease 3'-5' domain-containing protein 2-like [Haliotis rufescens]
MEKSVRVLAAAVLGTASVYAVVLTFRQLYKHFKTQSRKRQKRKRTNLEIHLISTPEEWQNQLVMLTEHLKIMKVVGLDCEWVSDHTTGHRSQVALLQMATTSGLCLLVRLCHMGSMIPQTLKDVLADPSILKVGVAVKDDGKKLTKDYGMVVQGCVDLRHLLTRVRHKYKCDASLQGLAEGVLGVTMDKRREIRCSDWEAHTLSAEQVAYAAADGQVGVDVFTKLVLTKLTGGDPGDLVWSMEGVDLEDVRRLARAMCQGIVDIGYRHSGTPRRTQTSAKQTEKPGIEKGRAYSARARPLYHNCQLQAPDGQPLCTCDIRKAEWYIEKQLGDKVCDMPLTVRLRFEPSGRPESESNYYLQEKENVCVVCGNDDTYTRKFVVPQEYRKYFPPLLKDHRSHDVLLLCPPCHQVSSNHDAILRQELAVECDAPIDSGPGCRSVQNQDLMKIRSAAKALTLSRAQIPEARVNVLEKTLMDFYGVTSLTDDLLETAIIMDTRIFNSDYVPHGKKVVEHFKQKAELWAFERRWRKNFVETMKPQFLPPLWSIEHHHNGVQSTH